MPWKVKKNLLTKRGLSLEPTSCSLSPLGQDQEPAVAFPVHALPSAKCPAHPVQ